MAYSSGQLGAQISLRAKQGFKEVKIGIEDVLTNNASLDMTNHRPLRAEFLCQPQPATNVLQTPNTLISTAIPKKKCKYVKGLVDQLQFSESGAANPVTPTKTPFMFDRIEYSQAGSPILQTLYSQVLWWAPAILMSDEKWSTVAPLYNSTTSYGLQPAIPVSGSRFNYLYHIGSIFDYLEPNGMDLAADLLINRWSSQNATAVSAGSGTLALQNILLSTDNDDVHKSFNEVGGWGAPGDKKAMCINYVDWQRQPYTQTITASQNNVIDLTGIVGRCPFLAFALRSSNSTANEGLSTYTAIDANGAGSLATIELRDSGSQAMLKGGATVYAQDVRQNYFMRQFNSRFAQSNPIYVLPFCDSITRAWKEGRVGEGNLYLDGSKYTINIVPDSGFTTGTYYIDLLVPYFKQVCMKNGMLSSVKL